MQLLTPRFLPQYLRILLQILLLELGHIRVKAWQFLIGLLVYRDMRLLPVNQRLALRGPHRAYLVRRLRRYGSLEFHLPPPQN